MAEGDFKGLRPGAKSSLRGCGAAAARALSVRGMTWAERRVDVPLFVERREQGLAC